MGQFYPPPGSNRVKYFVKFMDITNNLQLHAVRYIFCPHQVVYTFNAGTGPLSLVSSKTFNDGQWHKVETTREKTAGFLKIDDHQVGSGDEKSKGGASFVNKISVVYFGGIPKDSEIAVKMPVSLLQL